MKSLGEKIHRELKKALKGHATLKGHAATDAASRQLYCRDMLPEITLSLRRQGKKLHPQLPDAVCWPSNAQEIASLTRIANRHRIPLIPFGGGSGVLGGTLPVRGGIILDMKRMNRILAIDPDRFTADIETGKLGLQLENELNRKGFTLGHFPSSIMCATLGGYLATRSAGQLSSRYGKIEDMVEEIEVVTPQGQIVGLGRGCREFPKIKPTHLFVGTEGTCGVITKARLKIHPLPPAERYRAVSFNRLENALAALRHIMQAGLNPSILRLYDPVDSILFEHGYSAPPGLIDRIISPLVQWTSPFRRLLSGYTERIRQEGHSWFLGHPQLVQSLLALLPLEVILILGFEGDATFIEQEERMALSICSRFISRDLGPELGNHWKAHRYSVSFKMPQVFEQDGFVDTIEVAGTWRVIPELYRKVQRALSSKVLVMAHFSHAYPDGCSIYFTFAGKTGSYDKDLALYRQVWKIAMEGCLAAGGTISHHHGIGLMKGPYLEQELGNCMSLFRTFKKKLDPHNIMNPGKMGL